MSWDVVMFGSLSVPERNVEEWLTTPVSAASEAPWLDELGGNDTVLETPEALLAFLSEVTTAPHELFEVTHEGGRITVKCFVAEDPYRETCQALALLFSSAAAWGGAGELTFFGYQGIRFGERISVTHGTSSLTTLAQDELSAVERVPMYRELDLRIHERFDALVGRPPAPADPRRARWAINPFTGRKVRVASDP